MTQTDLPRNLGFRTFVSFVEVSDAGQVGKVISQDPAGGEKRTKGTTIVLTVGKAAASPTTTTTTTGP